MRNLVKYLLFAGGLLGFAVFGGPASADHCSESPLTTLPDGIGGSATHPTVGGVDASCVAPLFVDGNPTTEELVPLCSTLISPTSELKIDPVITGMDVYTGSAGQTIDVVVNRAGTVIESWTDLTSPANQQSGYPGVEAVFVKAGSGGNLYCYPYDTQSDVGLIGPPTGGGGLRSISHYQFGGSPGLCPLSEQYLTTSLGPELNPDIDSFPVQPPSCSEFPNLACCQPGANACTALDNPGFQVHYIKTLRIGPEEDGYCGIPPVIAVRGLRAEGETFEAAEGTTTVTTNINPDKESDGGGSTGFNTLCLPGFC